MADIKDQLIKDSYNYVLQSDLSTGVVYRIGGSVPVNPIFSSGLTVNSGFTYSNGTEQSGYALLTDGTGYAYWGPVSGASPSSGVTSITVGNGLSANSSTGAVTIVFTGSTSASGDYLPLSGGTVNGNTFFTSGLTANTLNVTGDTKLVNTSGTSFYTNYIDFNNSLTPLPSDVEGRMYWDEDNGTVSLIMHGAQVSQQIGLEQYYYVKNQSGTTIENGRVVRAAGTLGSSGRLLGEYMIANGSIPAKYTLGIATEDITNGEDGYVTEFGLVRGINTTGSLYGETWSDGTILWVSPTIPGGLTKFEPQSPNLKIEIAIVIKADNNGSMFVRPSRYPYMYDLQQVNYSAGTENNYDILQWGGSSWNKTNTPFFNGLTATTISATTYQNLPFSGTVTGGGTTNYVPKWTGSTGLGNSQIFDDGTNVGIGTTSPSAKLDINASTGGTIGVRISGNSSSDMLRITQTGSGNAILVEDSSNPDSTPFVVTSGGTIGVGITTPDSLLHVHNGSAGSVSPIGGTTMTIENNSTNYLSLLSSDSNLSGIVFGSPSDSFGSFIRWGHTSGKLEIGTGNANDYIEFYVENSSSKAYLSSTGFGVNKLPSAALDISGNTILRSGVVLSNLSSSANTRFIVSDSNGVLSYRTDVLTGTTITISGGTDISVTGTYPKFGVNFTGSTLVASNTCLIPANGRQYIGSSSVGWGYFQWDTEFGGTISPINVTNGIPLPKDVNQNDIIRVCGIAYCDASVPENDALEVILSYFICRDLTVNLISQSGYTYERNGTVCFNLEATYMGSDALLSCETFLILGFSSSPSDASQIKISYTIKIE